MYRITITNRCTDAGEWHDADHRPIEFDPAAWSIPYWDSKLYGGQQFERLLSEFKSVCDHTTLEDVTLHDIATAAGPNRLTTPANFAYTVSIYKCFLNQYLTYHNRQVI